MPLPVPPSETSASLPARAPLGWFAERMTDRTHTGAGTGAEDEAAAEAVARRDLAVRAAVVQGIVGEHKPLAGLLDVTGIRRATRALKSAFAAVVPDAALVQHTFAVKATPLVPVLRLLYEDKIGAEVASAGELALARAAGVRPAQIVLDSPAKTVPELREALEAGVMVNADNALELERIDALRAELPDSASTFGLRVNPQTGTGTIAATSTAGATSKFGVPLRDEGAREAVLAAFARRPWLTRLHTHSGSQGLELPALAEGVRVVYELAEEINAAAGAPQVDTVDIGGGLPVDLTSDRALPSHAQYAALLKDTVPGLFDGRYTVITEFGRSLLAKHGLALARVEYTKNSGGRSVAITHAGVQIAARTVYAPGSWPLRITAYDAQGRPKQGEEREQDVAGPACFAGDLLAERRTLPPLEPGDWIAVLDTGAYGFAHHYSYNSLARPGVHGFAAGPEGVRFATVRAAQTLAEIVAESGGEHTRALTDDL